MVDKMLAWTTRWGGKLHSYEGKLMLIRSYLANILIYMLSFFKFPKWTIQLVYAHMANYVWSDAEETTKSTCQIGHICA